MTKARFAIIAIAAALAVSGNAFAGNGNGNNGNGNGNQPTIPGTGGPMNTYVPVTNNNNPVATGGTGVGVGIGVGIGGTGGQPYRLTKDEGGLRRGAIVYKLTRSDYGCANDDTHSTGVEHVSVTLKKDGDWPGTSVPTHVLEPVPYKPHLTTKRGLWWAGPGGPGDYWICESPQLALQAWHMGINDA